MCLLLVTCAVDIVLDYPLEEPGTPQWEIVDTIDTTRQMAAHEHMRYESPAPLTLPRADYLGVFTRTLWHYRCP